MNLGGAERVLIALHKIFPEAPIYSLVYDKKFVKEYLPNTKITGSFLQTIPFIQKIYPYIPFLMPLAVENFRFENFDLIISSNIAFSKGIILKPHTRHICYCHSPTRWLWDWSSEYNQEFKKRGPLKYAGVTLFQHFARIWDKTASARVDYFIANSKNVAQRIWKYYRQDATVIYPPLTQLPIANCQSPIQSIKNHKLTTNNYFLIVSQLYKHKNIDVAIQAFSKLRLPLVIIGRGPEESYLKNLAKKFNARNIVFQGFVNDQELTWWYQNSIGFIMPQEEDFGITPVEAMSYGKPVLALRKGGALESVIEGVTGEFFDNPHPVVLADGVRRIYENIQKNQYSPRVIQSHALRFGEEQFKTRVLTFIKNVAMSDNKTDPVKKRG